MMKMMGREAWKLWRSESKTLERHKRLGDQIQQETREQKDQKENWEDGTNQWDGRKFMEKISFQRFDFFFFAVMVSICINTYPIDEWEQNINK